MYKKEQEHTPPSSKYSNRDNEHATIFWGGILGIVAGILICFWGFSLMENVCFLGYCERIDSDASSIIKLVGFGIAAFSVLILTLNGVMRFEEKHL